MRKLLLSLAGVLVAGTLSGCIEEAPETTVITPAEPRDTVIIERETESPPEVNINVESPDTIVIP